MKEYNSKSRHDEYFVGVTSQLITLLMGFAFYVITARYLGAELKGTVTYIIGVVETGSTALTLGLHHAYPYYRKKYGIDLYIKTFLSMVIKLYCLLAIVAITVAVFFSFSNIVKIIIVLIPLFSFVRVLGYVFLVENPNRRNITNVYCNICEIVLAIFLFSTVKRNLLIAVVLMTCKQVVTLFIYLKWIICEVGIEKRVSMSYFLEVVKYGFFPMISLLLTNLNFRIDILMLGNTRGISFSALGIYGLGVQLADKAGIIAGAAQEILLAHLANETKEKEVAKVIRVCMAITATIAVIFVLVGKQLISIFFGDEFADAYSITCLCLVSTIIIIVFKMIAQYNIVMARQKLNAVILVIGVMANILLNLIMVPRLGIVGAAIATIIGNGISTAIFLFYFSIVTRISVKDILVIKSSDLKTIKPFHKKEDS